MPSKELERQSVQRLLESRSDFEWDSFEASESPDFLLRRGERLIGIEVSRYSPPRKPNGFIAEEQDSLRHRVMSLSRDIYISAGGYPLHVQAIFKNHRAFRSARVDSLSYELADFLLRAPPFVPMHTPIPFARGDRFPYLGEIADVCAYKVSTRSMGAWYAGKGALVRDAESNDFAGVLRVKEPRLAEYKKRCAEVWLLVVFEMLAGGEYVQPPLDTKPAVLVSGFDRIFAVEGMGGGCIELPLAPALI